MDLDLLVAITGRHEPASIASVLLVLGCVAVGSALLTAFVGYIRRQTAAGIEVSPLQDDYLSNRKRSPRLAAGPDPH